MILVERRPKGGGEAPTWRNSFFWRFFSNKFPNKYGLKVEGEWVEALVTPLPIYACGRDTRRVSGSHFWGPLMTPLMTTWSSQRFPPRDTIKTGQRSHNYFSNSVQIEWMSSRWLFPFWLWTQHGIPLGSYSRGNQSLYTIICLNCNEIGAVVLWVNVSTIVAKMTRDVAIRWRHHIAKMSATRLVGNIRPTSSCLDINYLNLNMIFATHFGFS